MTDQISIQGGQAVLTTNEGQAIERPEAELVEMIRKEILPPLNGVALPDGVKFLEWKDPLLVIVHQMPPHVRRLQWIAKDSPEGFGPGTKYRKVRISVPYAITFSVFYAKGDRLCLTGANELYFRNAPLKSKADDLGFPALLNISQIKRKRAHAWICTQYLKRKLDKSWSDQLEALLGHTWNGAFNRSSEFHEGASWYSASKGVHPDLHPIEKWEEATERNEAFALSVKWIPASLNVGEMIDAILNGGHLPFKASMTAAASAKRGKSASLASRFMNFVQRMKG